MKRVFFYVYVLSLAAFFATSMGIGWVGNLRFVVVLPLLVLAIVKSAQYPTRISVNVMIAIWMFLTWCLLTCFWSENFTLSILKLAIFGGTVMAFCLGGMLIPAEYPELNPYLTAAPIFCYAVIGSVIHPISVEGNVRGVTGNSNMLAACILFSMPWYFVELQSKWASRYMRRILIVLGVAALIILVLSRSRTMIVSAIACSFLLFLSLKPGRKIILAYGLTILLMLSIAFIPDLLSTVNTNYVYKSSERLLDSRGEQMAESFDYATKGGTIGAGFGVSIGMGRYWEIGSTFGQYNREKGNSAMAIVEEIGLVGLALWLFLFLMMAVEVRALGRKVGPASTPHFIYLLTLGYLLAAFLSSMAEAWVLSPSPETALFWATIGLSIGALKRDVTQPTAFGSAA